MADANAQMEKIKQIIVEQLGVDENEVTPEAHFIDDLGADSLDTVELIMALEEEFGIEISDEDAEKIQKVGDVLSYIKDHSKAWFFFPKIQFGFFYRTQLYFSNILL